MLTNSENNYIVLVDEEDYWIEIEKEIRLHPTNTVKTFRVHSRDE